MIRLKDFVLPSEVFQSPMASCTDLAFRLVARERGLKFGFAEMISAEALVRWHRKTHMMLAPHPDDTPLGVQIVGANPRVMGTAAKIIEQMGYALLDLNLGCPVPKITGNGGGCALMKDPDTAREIFCSVVHSVKAIPVTVKMRLGLSDSSGREAVCMAQLAEKCGLDAVTVHGRTQAQGYSGKADYEAIARIKEAVRIPVFGNGDVFDGPGAVLMKKMSGVDGIMIGRGGLGNPWIYSAAAEALGGRPEPARPGLDERKRTVLRHMEFEIQYGGRCALYLMRRVACWYYKELPGVARFRDQIHRAASFDEIRGIIENFDVSVN